MIVAPIGAFYTWFMMKLQVAAPDITGVDIGLLWWFLGACVLEAVISIVMIVVMNVIKRNDLRDFQGKGLLSLNLEYMTMFWKVLTLEHTKRMVV